MEQSVTAVIGIIIHSINTSFELAKLTKVFFDDAAKAVIISSNSRALNFIFRCCSLADSA